MTRHGPALLSLTMLAIAGWTYNVNYDTRAALDRLSDLRARIADEREALQVLRVEWAWLNAPDRLTRLLGEHNDRLALMPLTPEALGHVAAVPYPPDMPRQPLPAYPPEMLVASAPQAQPPATAGVVAGDTLAAAPQPASEPAPPGSETSLPDAGQAGTPQAETVQVAAASEPPTSFETVLAAGADVTPSTPSMATPTAGGTAPRADDPVIAAAAEKAETLATGTASPATMQEAVTLALIEAGVVQAGSLAEAAAQPAAVATAVTAALVPASAGAGIPVPQARPAVWAQR